MMTTVVHCKKEKYDIYIGRRRGTNEHFGNPFSHLDSPGTYRVKDRAAAIHYHMMWLRGHDLKDYKQEQRLWILDNLELLRDKVLGCWCKPKDCHGDNYVILLEEIRQGKLDIVR
jgi:hypothetical protein